MTRIAVLKTFFGFLPGQTLMDFKRELDNLTEAEKDELAALAAAQLGVTIDAK